MCHYSDLGSASDWSFHKGNSFQSSEALLRTWKWHIFSTEFLLTSFHKETSGGITKFWLFSQVTVPMEWGLLNWFWCLLSPFFGRSDRVIQANFLRSHPHQLSPLTLLRLGYLYLLAKRIKNLLSKLEMYFIQLLYVV